MPDSKSWDVIFGADSGRVVLGAGFPVRLCREAGFPDLAVRIGPGYRFLQTKPPAARSWARPCGDAYVGPWIEDIRQGRHRVLAVLGHGVGSVYAAAIAEGISEWQPAPKVILFDPQLATYDHLGLEFRREIGSMSSLLSDDELDRAAKITAEISGPVAGDIADIAAELVESYFEVITAAFERAGLGDARDSKFSTTFESYMAWLSVADQIDPEPVWKRSTAIASSACGEQPGRAYPGDDGGAVGRIIPLGVGQADLLRSDSAARIVLDLLRTATHKRAEGTDVGTGDC